MACHHDGPPDSCLACCHDGQLACQPCGMLATQPDHLPARCTSCLPSCQPSGSVADMIIVLANSKGGVGKTSISVHLATWLAEQGHSVILADCDSQKSSGEWLAEAAPEIRTVRLADPTRPDEPAVSDSRSSRHARRLSHTALAPVSSASRFSFRQKTQ